MKFEIQMKWKVLFKKSSLKVFYFLLLDKQLQQWWNVLEILLIQNRLDFSSSSVMSPRHYYNDYHIDYNNYSKNKRSNK